MSTVIWITHQVGAHGSLSEVAMSLSSDGDFGLRSRSSGWQAPPNCTAASSELPERASRYFVTLGALRGDGKRR